MVLKYNNDKAKTNFLHKVYYDDGYKVGRDRLFHYTYHTLGRKDISRRYLYDFLSRQEVHQRYSQRKKATNIRPIVTSRAGAMLQIDLIDMSKNPSEEGFAYILNVIDVFSRKIWLQGLKRKTLANVIPELNYIVQEIQKDYKVDVIQSDNGNEFNISFPNIKHVQSRPYTPQAQGIVEKSNYMVKRIMFKMLYGKEKQWTDPMLLEIEDVYNNTINRMTGKSPNELYNEGKNQEVVDKQKANHAKKYKEVNTVLEVGDKVRIIIEKGNPLISKKGSPLWSKEIYTVFKVINGNKKTFTINRYKLKDTEGILVKNTFPLSKLLLIPN